MPTAKEVFESVKKAALAATGLDESALQIDYEALEKKIVSMLGDRSVAMVHINRHLPEGYEDQGHFNVIVVTKGNVVYDMVIGDSYFRHDIFAATDLNKIQTIDGIYKNTEKREEIPFLSVRLQHGDEAHVLLGLDDDQRATALAIGARLSLARHPE